MLRLEISNLTFNGFKPIGNITQELTTIFHDAFVKANINVNINYKEQFIYFKPVSSDKGREKLFSSKVINRVPLKKDDSRIKSVGRDYLNTDRLTKEQEEQMWEKCINGVLNALGLCAVIKLYEHFDEDKESFITLRDGYEYKAWPLKQKAYPISLK